MRWMNQADCGSSRMSWLVCDFDKERVSRIYAEYVGQTSRHWRRVRCSRLSLRSRSTTRSSTRP